jgi:putative hydrolase of HD superfamily
MQKISLVHDLAEALVGDITPNSGISKEEKNKLEEAAMKKIKDTLAPSSIGEELYQLWLEYETKSSLEARIVKDLDKFEMILQAFEYEESQNLTLQSFYDSTKDQFSHPQVKSWVEQLYERRKVLQNKKN